MEAILRLKSATSLGSFKNMTSLSTNDKGLIGGQTGSNDIIRRKSLSHESTCSNLVEVKIMLAKVHDLCEKVCSDLITKQLKVS